MRNQLASKCGLIAVENYIYSRYRKNYHGFSIYLKSAPEGMSFSGVTIDTSKYENADELLEKEFGVTVGDVISVIISKLVHGNDRNGRYMVTDWDARFRKRPKRHRPKIALIPHIEKYLSNPSGAYGNEKIKPEWECSACGLRGERKIWPWSKNFMFDTEYISHCPKCEKGRVAKNNADLTDIKAISTKLLGKDITSGIVKRWSHRRPNVMHSGSKEKKMGGNGYKGAVFIIDNPELQEQT